MMIRSSSLARNVSWQDLQASVIFLKQAFQSLTEASSA